MYGGRNKDDVMFFVNNIPLLLKIACNHAHLKINSNFYFTRHINIPDKDKKGMECYHRQGRICIPFVILFNKYDYLIQNRSGDLKRGSHWRG